MRFLSNRNRNNVALVSYPTANDIPAELQPGWLYQGLAEIYSSWLSAEALQQFLINARYSEEVAPGFRIIAVNSNMAQTYNL